MNRKELFQRMKAFPKVDLHRHLEGSITAETLVSIAAKYGGTLPASTVEQLRPFVQMDAEQPGFAAFLKKFLVYRGFYTCPEAIQEIAYAAVKEAALDNVRYLELRYSPSHFAGKKFKEDEVITWIHRAIMQAATDFSIIVAPILTISRDYGLELATSTVKYVAALEKGYFYGLDIAGDEVHNSARPFADLFALAKHTGLKLTIHAGEAGSPENIRQAIVEFEADRIGHGVRAVESPDIMELLRERKILLELCLTSNVHTGVIASLDAHPIARLRKYGIPVSINTDDPAISAINLSGEYVEAVSRLGFTEEELKKINLEALEYAFYPDKKQLREQLACLWR